MPSGTPEGQIIVTGGSRGIGAAIVHTLAGQGRRVVSLSRTGAMPPGVTGEVTAMACDLADETALRDAMAQVAGQGPIAGLVNNAGIHLTGKSAELATETFEQVMRVNTTALMACCREVYPHLKGSGGLIVNIGSFFDKMGVPHNLAYAASKAAVGAITRCLAVEWARDHIAVLNVAPGYIATELNADYLARDKVREWIAQRIPGGQVGQPEDVARVVAMLFSGAPGFLTGETIYLDGGQGMNH